MLDEVKQPETVQQPTAQHPYQNTQERTVCDTNDKECISRLVAAFSDCD